MNLGTLACFGFMCWGGGLVLSQEELTVYVLVVVEENHEMSNAKVAFEMRASGHSKLVAEERREVPVVRYSVEDWSTCWVLDLNRNPWTLIIIIHEEAVNQFTKMAYFGRIFSGMKVCMRALSI